ncbi:MAG TPA: hypothetical protein VH414_11925 [Lichenihabitans sp.]|nr:hypothetical protein [Lichenihabitans sp.]
MKASTLAMIICCGLAVGGCETTQNPYDPPKPLDKMNHQELCSYYKVFLSDPNLSPGTRQIATAKMRQQGCPS